MEMVRSVGLVVGYDLLFILNSSYLHLIQQWHDSLCATRIEKEKAQIYNYIFVPGHLWFRWME